MQQMTVELPDDLALRLSPLRSQLPQILEMGLREWNSDVTAEFSGLAEVLECLAGLPTPEEILALRPSEKLTEQISALLEKNRTIGLNESEERLWQHYKYVEYLVQMAKAKALLNLKLS
jgi:hypothetical protein